MVIMIAGTIRSDVIHVHPGFGECHEAVYAVINPGGFAGKYVSFHDSCQEATGHRKKIQK